MVPPSFELQARWCLLVKACQHPWMVNSKRLPRSQLLSDAGAGSLLLWLNHVSAPKHLLSYLTDHHCYQAFCSGLRPAQHQVSPCAVTAKHVATSMEYLGHQGWTRSLCSLSFHMVFYCYCIDWFRDVSTMCKPSFHMVFGHCCVDWFWLVHTSL